MLFEQLQNPFFVFLLLILLSVFTYVIKHTEYIPGFVFFLFASLGAVLQLTNIGQIGLLRAILLLVLFGVLFHKNLKKGVSLPIGGILLVLSYLLSVYVSGSINDIPFSSYRSEVGLLIMAIVVSVAPNKKETLRILTIAILLWGLINAFAIITAKLGIGWGKLVLFNNGGRAIGLSRHSTFMGAYFSIALVAAQILFLQANLKITKVVMFASGMLIMLGLLATIARGAFIGWLAAFLFVQYRIQGMKVSSIVGVFLIAIMAISVASLLGLDQLLLDRFTGIEKDTSAQARIPLLLSSLNTFSKNPVFGTGIGWEDVKLQLESHNMIIQVLVEEGLIGFILFMFILWKAGWSLLVRSNAGKAVNIMSAPIDAPKPEEVSSKRLSSGVILKRSQRSVLTNNDGVETAGVDLSRESELLQKTKTDLVVYYTGLVAMLGAILLNSLTHSFDFFMPLWMLIGVGFMRTSK
ncbi:MAG TPA: hypothetical protein ENJ28_08255 [Gammaproteobacteria bacterium]|nr:hypothetical protein [Gammaproteobacteria bacterium]